jgi:hypothetical protein
MYQNMEQAVSLAFSDDNPTGNEIPLLSKSMYSFKVLSECPVIVALLISLHRKFSQGHVPILVPLMMHVIHFLFRLSAFNLQNRERFMNSTKRKANTLLVAPLPSSKLQCIQNSKDCK